MVRFNAGVTSGNGAKGVTYEATSNTGLIPSSITDAVIESGPNNSFKVSSCSARILIRRVISTTGGDVHFSTFSNQIFTFNGIFFTNKKQKIFFRIQKIAFC